MSEYDSEYDLRQYRLMLERIERPILKMQHFLTVIKDLEALISVLKKKDQEWLSKFSRQWWILEDLYAIHGSSDLDNIGEESLREIEMARCEIARLVEMKIQEEIINSPYTSPGSK